MILAPLTDDASADEITAAAERHRQASTDAAVQAERDQAEAEAIMSAAREEAARIIAEAEAAAHPFTASASEAGNAAGTLAERAQRLSNAAGHAAKAEASEARAEALEDERDELTARQADISQDLARLAAQRRELEPQLAAALDSADLDQIAGLRTKLDSIAALEQSRQAQRAPVAARLAAIGNGEMSPAWPQKELAEARRVASMDRNAVRAALNYALPERPEAVADAARQHQQLLNRMQTEQFAQWAAEDKRKAQQPQVVRIGR